MAHGAASTESNSYPSVIVKTVTNQVKKMRISILSGALLFLGISGCATSTTMQLDNCERRTFDEVTLAPGCFAICTEEPCSVTFRLPSSKDNYQVSYGPFVLGSSSAGQTIFIGSYWQGVYQFTTTDNSGNNLRPAYLFVGGDMN
jgi:hypothetical protein